MWKSIRSYWTITAVISIILIDISYSMMKIQFAVTTLGNSASLTSLSATFPLLILLALAGVAAIINGYKQGHIVASVILTTSVAIGAILSTIEHIIQTKESVYPVIIAPIGILVGGICLGYLLHRASTNVILRS